VYCDEITILRRQGEGLEKEVDTFAAALLMPFHDFRRQLPANERADFERLTKVARRYGVSLTAAILRWLEYTETRVIMIVSNEGFALRSRSSDAAFKSGRFVRTKQTTFELQQRPSLHGVSSRMKLNWGFNNPLALGTSLNQSWKCAFVRSVMTKKSRYCSSKESQRSSTKKSRCATRSINL
jgi:hypothetical protein